MTKLEKKLGAREKCPSCQNDIFCREVEYKGEKKLQWQNEDGTSHYSFDYKTKVTSCKEVVKKAEGVKEQLNSPTEIHLGKIPFTVEEISVIQEAVSEKMNSLAVTYVVVRQKLAEFGLIDPNPALVGMFFNRVREELRVHD